MDFTEKDLLLAQKKGVISADDFVALLNFLRGLHANDVAPVPVSEPLAKPEKKKFTMENFLYYFGAVIIMLAMGWYLGRAWESFGHGGLLAVCLLYFVIFTLLGNFLWKKDKKTPGGLLYVCAVSIVPLAVWAFESLVGWMPKNLSDYSDFHIWIRGGWIFMEIATILAGLTFLKFRKVPFMTLPICYSAWYMSMDIVPICLGNFGEPTWGIRNFATAVFGILMLGFAMKYDKKYEEDFSQWLYLFSATMLWCVIGSVLCQFKWDNEFAYFFYGLFSFAYMIFSIVIRRKVFMVWGAIGTSAYIAHLAYVIFKDSPLFPLVLVLFGLAVIFAGVYYAKNCEKLETSLRGFILPKK